MGKVRAIGFALAALFAWSEPAMAPPLAASARDHASNPCAAIGDSGILLDCPPESAAWLDAGLAPADPLATTLAVTAPGDAPIPFQGTARPQPRDVAEVPEPGPLGAVATGVAGLAAARRRRRTTRHHPP